MCTYLFEYLIKYTCGIWWIGPKNNNYYTEKKTQYQK